MKSRQTLPKQKIADFCRRHHVKKLSIFGSSVQGTPKPDSDIDVLVEFEKEYTPGLAFFDMESNCPISLEKR